MPTNDLHRRGRRSVLRAQRGTWEPAAARGPRSPWRQPSARELPPYAGKTLVVVLCMHRSGSSVTTNVLQRLGMSLGPFELLGATQYNPCGHYEAEPFYDLDRELMEAAFGFSMDLPDEPGRLRRFLKHEGRWFAGGVVTEDRLARGRELVRQLIESGPVAGFKDPRAALLWPFWSRVLESFPRLRVVPLFVVRSPHETAMSIYRRSFAYHWRRLYHDCLDACEVHFKRMLAIRGMWPAPHALVRFDPKTFAADLRRAAATCGLPWSEEAFESVYDPAFRHHEPCTILHGAQQLYNKLAAAPAGDPWTAPANLQRLDQDAAVRELAAWQHIEGLQGKLGNLDQRLQSARADAASCRTLYNQSEENRHKTIGRMELLWEQLQEARKRLDDAQQRSHAAAAQLQALDRQLLRRQQSQRRLKRSARERLGQLDARLHDALVQCEQAKAAIAALERDADRQRLEYEGRLHDSRRQQEELQQQLAAAQQQAAEAQQQAAEAQQQAAEAQQQAAESQQQATEAQQQAAEAQQHAAEAQRQANEETQRLEADLRSLGHHRERLEQELAVAKSSRSYRLGKAVVRMLRARPGRVASSPVPGEIRKWAGGAKRAYRRVRGLVRRKPGVAPPSAPSPELTQPLPHEPAPAALPAVTVGAYEDEQHPGMADPAVKLIAYYLPQFHPIPENDAWWGRGFTEWTNVTKARPLYHGHYQPHLPGELGFYDLRVPEVLQRQIELARQYGIHGFCFYYYWFSGKRLLERPLDMFLDHPEWDFPFCLCWANENWTRRWDGQEKEVLIAQTHSAEDDLACIEDLGRYLRDPRYIRVEGKPLVVVYRVNILPDPQATAERWRRWCREAGLGEVMLVAAQTFGITDPTPYGFDAAVEFPPHGISAPNAGHAVAGLHPDFQGQIYSYPDIALENPPKSFPYPHFKTVCTSWDNAARRDLAAHVFAGATPQAYETWLEQTVAFTSRHHPPEHRLAFVNAWNEWAEGAHLEPDRAWGYAYLNATARVLAKYPADRGESTAADRQPARPPDDLVSVVVPAYNHEAYIEGALDSVRRQRLSGPRTEVIVVDDGSTDGTAARVEAFMARHPDLEIRLVRQENGGAHAAINRGVRESRGTYVTILNSDDQFHPGRIQTLYDALRGSGQALCFSDFEVIDGESNPVNESRPYVRHLRENVAQIAAYPSIGYSLLTFNSAISTGNLFFTRELFDRIGGFSNLAYCHDWDFVVSALEFTVPVRVDQKLYRYRLHETNTFSGLGEDVAHRESRLVLHKAARRVLQASSPDAYPSLTESHQYLTELLGKLGHPLSPEVQPRAA